jgi:DNA-directed RNA polymerase specialized sigma24 family protein
VKGRPPDVRSPKSSLRTNKERLERYEAALARLQPAEQEAVIARLELQQSYDEVALALGNPRRPRHAWPSPGAVKNLVKAMDEN